MGFGCACVFQRRIAEVDPRTSACACAWATKEKVEMAHTQKREASVRACVSERGGSFSAAHDLTTKCTERTGPPATEEKKPPATDILTTD